jgi:hypothetical protein
MKTKSYKELHWILRGLSGLFIAGFVIGENSSAPLINNALTNNAILQLSVAGMGMIGLGIAWKWELIGGIVASVAFIGLIIINPSLLDYGLLLIWPITAILFIVLWALRRNRTEKNK